MSQTSSFSLSATPQKNASLELFGFLGAHRENHIEIDAADIETLSGPQLEVLLCGYRQWQSEDLSFCVINARPPLQQRMTDVGVPPELFAKDPE